MAKTKRLDDQQMRQLMRACGESLLELLPNGEDCGVCIVVASPNEDGWNNAYYSSTGLDVEEQWQLMGTALLALARQQEELAEEEEARH